MKAPTGELINEIRLEVVLKLLRFLVVHGTFEMARDAHMKAADEMFGGRPS